jgi:hypothetical protein
VAQGEKALSSKPQYCKKEEGGKKGRRKGRVGTTVMFKSRQIKTRGVA